MRGDEESPSVWEGGIWGIRWELEAQCFGKKLFGRGRDLGWGRSGVPSPHITQGSHPLFHQPVGLLNGKVCWERESGCPWVPGSPCPPAPTHWVFVMSAEGHHAVFLAPSLSSCPSPNLSSRLTLILTSAWTRPRAGTPGRERLCFSHLRIGPTLGSDGRPLRGRGPD